MATPALSVRLRRPEAHDTGPRGQAGGGAEGFLRFSQPFPFASPRRKGRGSQIRPRTFLNRLCFVQVNPHRAGCDPRPRRPYGRPGLAASAAQRGRGQRRHAEREPVNGGGLTALAFRSRARALGRQLDGAPQWTNSLGVSARVAGPGQVPVSIWEAFKRNVIKILGHIQKRDPNQQ